MLLVHVDHMLIHVGHLLMLAVSLVEVWMVVTKVVSEIFMHIPPAIALD
jgi:hypothetical protein